MDRHGDGERCPVPAPTLSVRPSRVEDIYSGLWEECPKVKRHYVYHGKGGKLVFCRLSTAGQRRRRGMLHFKMSAHIASAWFRINQGFSCMHWRERAWGLVGFWWA